MKATHVHDPFHCLVWIDHRTARIYAVMHEALSELALIHAPDQGQGHLHHHAGSPGSGHEAISAEFLNRVIGALQNSAEILITGPAQAKHALKDFITAKAPVLASRIVGVEALDKVTDGQLHEFACRFFHRADRMGTGAAAGNLSRRPGLSTHI